MGLLNEAYSNPEPGPGPALSELGEDLLKKTKTKNVSLVNLEQICPVVAAPKSKTQSLPSLLAMAQTSTDRPTAVELEAAIVVLPAKKDALRKAFDILVAGSPSPLPFIWDGLDAHISTLHSSILLRFRQLQVLEADRPTRSFPAPSNRLEDQKSKNHYEDSSEDEEWEEVEEMEEVVDEGMRVADSKIDTDREDNKGSREKRQEEIKDEEGELETVDTIIKRSNDEKVRDGAID